MLLKWRFYSLACIINIAGSLVFAARITHIDIQDKTSSDISVTLIAYTCIALIILKALLGFRLLKKLENHQSVTGSFKLLFYILMSVHLIFIAILAYGAVESFEDAVNKWYTNIFSALFYLSVLALLAGNMYCIIFDIPLVRKVQKQLFPDLEFIGKEE